MFLVMFPVHWMILLITWWVGDDSLNLFSIFSAETLEQAAFGFVLPSATIFFGAWIAPAHTNGVANILAILMIGWFLSLHSLVILNDDLFYGFSDFGWIRIGVFAVINVVGIYLGRHWVREREWILEHRE